MQQILVAIDLSEHEEHGAHTERVLAKAAELARALGAELTILHVAAPDPDFVGFEVGPQSVRDNRADALEREHRELHRMAEALRGEGLQARAFLIAGATAETILGQAEKRAADLIVLGTHARSSVVEAFLGSVSRAVIHGATCPVVVVPVRVASAK